MKMVILVIVYIISTYRCTGQLQDTLDLTLPVDLSHSIIKYRRMPNNSIYLELAGHLNFISLNYERVFLHIYDFYLTGRVGAGYIPPSVNTISFPCLVNGLYQVSNVVFIELGFGVCLTYNFWKDYYSDGEEPSASTFHESGSFYDPLITGVLGIRVQKKKGFLFRFGFTPLIEFMNPMENSTIYKQTGSTNSFLPWVGMSFGYSFNNK